MAYEPYRKNRRMRRKRAMPTMMRNPRNRLLEIRRRIQKMTRHLAFSTRFLTKMISTETIDRSTKAVIEEPKPWRIARRTSRRMVKHLDHRRPPHSDTTTTVEAEAAGEIEEVEVVAVEAFKTEIAKMTIETTVETGNETTTTVAGMKDKEAVGMMDREAAVGMTDKEVVVAITEAAMATRSVPTAMVIP